MTSIVNTTHLCSNNPSDWERFLSNTLAHSSKAFERMFNCMQDRSEQVSVDDIQQMIRIFSDAPAILQSMLAEKNGEQIGVKRARVDDHDDDDDDY